MSDPKNEDQPSDGLVKSRMKQFDNASSDNIPRPRPPLSRNLSRNSPINSPRNSANLDDNNPRPPPSLSRNLSRNSADLGKQIPCPSPRPSLSRNLSRNSANFGMVSDSKLFTNAMQLIYSDTDGKLQCSQDTIAELQKIDKPVNVVAVTGRYRTGKSFLLNRLYGQSLGERFKVGHTTTAETKGIWIQCKPHPTQEGQVMMLMDTEGIGDIKKVNINEDRSLFVLVTLLSSTLVYNIKGGFDNDAIKKLKFLKDMESSINVSGEDNDHMLIDFFCPVFVVALRDHHLKLDEATPTPDGYLEDCLEIVRMQNVEGVDKYNSIRKAIRKYFLKRKCFTFGLPCDLKKTGTVDKIPDRDLDPDFVETLQSFSEYVFGCNPVMLKSGRNVNGRMLGSRTIHYVNSIRDGQKPSIREASKAMAATENEFVVIAAGNLYKQEMQKRIASINPEDSTLENFDKDCRSIAIKFLKDAIVIDDQDVYEKQAVNKFKDILTTFKNICDKGSEAKCRDVLGRLNLRIQRKMKAHEYKHPSGYDEYMTDVNTLVKRFEATTGLGAKSRSVLQEFIDGKTDEEQAVFQMVAENQTGNGDVANGSNIERPKSEMQNAITKSKSFREQLNRDIEEMEKQLETDIEATQKEGIKTLRGNIDENVQLKLNEIERQLTETVKREENKKAIESLEDQRSYLIHVLDQSKQKSNGNHDDDNVYDISLDKFSLGTQYTKPDNTKPKSCKIL